jgi:multiple sugar transport system ATP-binding protein
MAELRLESLRKEFGGETAPIIAIDNLNLEIEDGEFIVLVGPSGCGKSTTLRCIAGLEEPTSGRLMLANQDITEQTPSNRDIAMVFQNYALYPHMTAFGNIAFGLKMGTNLSDDEIRRRVEEAADFLEISDLLDKHPSELSGGQQQRVALGRAIVREPEVFLLDEPLSNLDAKLRATMRAELQELQNELNVTTLYVTHDQTEAMTMGDRIAILNGGELQQFDTPLACYHHPNNQFVAGFIVSPPMNFFDMVYEDGWVRNETFEYEIAGEITLNSDTIDREVIVGIRPEDILVLNEPTDKSLTVDIEVVEPMGERTILYSYLGGDRFIINSSDETMYKEGESIQIEFPRRKIHLFDRENGLALRDYEAQSILSETR